MDTERTSDLMRAPHWGLVPRSVPSAAIEPFSESVTPRRSVLEMLWRRRWVVLLAVLSSAAAGLLYLSHATPIYSSSSRLLVEQTGPKIIETGEGLVARSRNYLYTQCELLKSTPILTDAVDRLAPDQLRTFGQVSDPVALLKSNLRVSLGKADDIITVTMESPYPKEAAVIVNAVVESYIAYQSRRQRNTAAEILKILQREKVRRDAELRQRFQAAMEFKRRNEIISFGSDDSNIILQRLATLSDALTRAELALMEAKARHEAARVLLADPRKMLHLRDKLLAGEGTSSVEAQALEEERNRLKLELTALRQQCTDDHPAVQTIKLKLKQLDEQELQRAQALAKARLGWLEQQVAAAQARVDDLKKSFAAQRKLAQELNSKAVEYAMLEAERQRAERICEILDNRIKEIDITDDAGALNISLLESARASEVPCKPRKAQAMGIALSLGVLLGVGLALIGEWMDHRLRSAEEISEALGLPVLGVVPQLSGRKGLSSVARIADLEPSSQAAEAYRTVRTAVYFGAPDVETKTLLVTSPAPGDGKTTLVSNLAIAMAQAGQRVVVLDADFRRPSQHKVFQVEEGAAGVPEVLAGLESLEGAVRSTGIERLHLLPCSNTPPNPAEMLNSQAFGDLLGELARRYDRVLVDAPPVLSLADARILGARCDAGLLVLRAEKSSRKPSQQAVDSLLSVGTRLLGVVVNGAVTGRRGYGYHDYGYYYRHGRYGRELEGRTDRREGDEAVEAEAA